MNFKSLLFLGVGTTLTKDFLVKYVNESPSIEKVVTIISDKNQEIIFINFWWKIIMSIVKLIPEKIFKRLSF